jgi:hypothetical protein
MRKSRFWIGCFWIYQVMQTHIDVLLRHTHVVFLLRQTHVVFFMGRHKMIEENINRTQWTVMVYLYSYVCNSSLISTLLWSSLHWERHGREVLLAPLMVLIAPTDSCWLGGGLAVSAGLCYCCWFVFAISVLLTQSAGVLTEIGIAPRNYF